MTLLRGTFSISANDSSPIVGSLSISRSYHTAELQKRYEATADKELHFCDFASAISDVIISVDDVISNGESMSRRNEELAHDLCFHKVPQANYFACKAGCSGNDGHHDQADDKGILKRRGTAYIILQSFDHFDHCVFPGLNVPALIHRRTKHLGLTNCLFKRVVFECTHFFLLWPLLFSMAKGGFWFSADQQAVRWKVFGSFRAER
jgi:hypothetical protein